jgi:ribosomal-protein-alanine N-acetyltransferase
MRAYRIRESVPFDLAGILAIQQSTFHAAHWTEDAYAQMWNNPQSSRVCFVAEEEGQLLGFVVGKDIAGEWELESLAVVPEAQQQGIGRALLEKLTHVVSVSAGAKLFLEVRESNAAARKLYESQGFVSSGRRKTYYRDPIEDALLYEKNFADSNMKTR